VSLYSVDSATFTLFTLAATGTIHLVLAEAVCTLHYAEHRHLLWCWYGPVGRIWYRHKFLFCCRYRDVRCGYWT